ncbi:MAG: carboxypeptidase regulatory-like domain-containing protein [Vicinamibacterales bacterium]
MFRRLVAVAAIAPCVTVLVATSPDVTPLVGRVVDITSEQPLVNARVWVQSGIVPTATLTDGDGRFAIARPGAARVVSARKAGYGRADMAVPEDGSAVTIRLSRGAAISGTVRDDEGEALMGTQVTVERLITSTTSALTVTTQCDDRGEYRIGMLPAGRYRIRFRGVPTPPMAVDGSTTVTGNRYAQVYYPRSVRSGAGGAGGDCRRRRARHRRHALEHPTRAAGHTCSCCTDRRCIAVVR